jgi:hypothetical protein
VILLIHRIGVDNFSQKVRALIAQYHVIVGSQKRKRYARETKHLESVEELGFWASCDLCSAANRFAILRSERYAARPSFPTSSFWCSL